MKRIIKTVLCVTVAACFSLSPFAVWAGPGSANIDSQIGEAVQALESRDYNKIIKLLQPFDGQEMEGSSMVQVQYLLGSAKFRRTDLALKANREKGLQKKDQLKENQIDSLREAFGHFKAAQDIDPTNKFAPECLYMTGKILDWGYMQRFKESMDNYTATYERYPGTEFGMKARESYQRLKSAMAPHQKSPHLNSGTPRGKNPHGGAI
jgi:hypothetical protein